jgi:hypothetical protein
MPSLHHPLQCEKLNFLEVSGVFEKGDITRYEGEKKKEKN